MTEPQRILVVDDSRLVRMALVRNLKGQFDVREEGDGESAWQQLILDHSIRAVISDLQMPKLDGFGLLQRVRASKQRRLQEMPFIDRVVFSLEKEQVPYWNKFLQGYYDASGIASDTFDQAVQFSGQGDVTLSEGMAKRGISLQTSLATSVF